MLPKTVRWLRLGISFVGAAVGFIVCLVLMYIASVPTTLAYIIAAIYGLFVGCAGWIITRPRPTIELDDDSEN